MISTLSRTFDNCTAKLQLKSAKIGSICIISKLLKKITCRWFSPHLPCPRQTPISAISAQLHFLETVPAPTPRSCCQQSPSLCTSSSSPQSDISTKKSIDLFAYYCYKNDKLSIFNRKFILKKLF